MFDQLLRIGSQFDYVSPMVAFVQDLLYGPSITFLIDESSCAWSANRIKELLESHGIKTWGLLFALDAEGDVIMITVKREQALWAQYLMLRAGLPLRNGLRSTQPSAPRLPGRRRPQILGLIENVAEAFWNKLGL